MEGLWSDVLVPGDAGVTDATAPEAEAWVHPDAEVEEPETAAEDVPAEALAEDVFIDPCPDDGYAEPAVTGTIYHDADKTSNSYHSQGFYMLFDAAIPDVEVALTGASKDMSTTTCPDGSFGFGGLADGAYLIDVKLPPDTLCTSTNRSVRLPQAIDEGKVVLVTIGDSIGVVGSNELFPARLANLLSSLATVDNRNLAVGGSKAKDWLPGSNHFENKLKPNLPDADVVVITVGGNDLQGYMPPKADYDFASVMAKLAGMPDFMAGLNNDIHTIITETQALAPHADVVYIVYMNYANSQPWKDQYGQYAGLVIAGLYNTFDDMRELASAIPGVILADMFGALGDEPVGGYMSDFVHLNDAGHQLYAEQIFLSLGGALVGAEPLGLERMFGFFVEP